MSASTYMHRSLYIFFPKSLHLYLARHLQAGIALLIFIHTYVLHILLQISTGVKAWLQKKGLWENPNGSARAGKKKTCFLAS
jgi:TM2 domain-containing membrane protein YozV